MGVTLISVMNLIFLFTNSNSSLNFPSFLLCVRQIDAQASCNESMKYNIKNFNDVVCVE